MSNKVKDIDIKKQRFYFFNDIINIKNFVPNNIKIDKKSYCIGFVTIKDSKFQKLMV